MRKTNVPASACVLYIIIITAAAVAAEPSDIAHVMITDNYDPKFSTAGKNFALRKVITSYASNTAQLLKALTLSSVPSLQFSGRHFHKSNVKVGKTNTRIGYF